MVESGNTAFFVGSTTERAVREAVCPVLTARAVSVVRAQTDERTTAVGAART
jgi:hypothetical protein